MKILTVLYHYFTTKYFLKFSSRKKLEQYQQWKLKRLLKIISKRSRYFKTVYSNLSNWEDEAGILTKEKMMTHFDDINTVGVSKEQALNYAIQSEENRSFDGRINGCTVGLSSGTSGNRGLFLVSPYEEALWAGKMFAKVLPGSLLRKHQIALFLRSNSNLYESSNAGPIAFNYFDMILPFAEHLKRLIQMNPTLIIAPPSILKQIAQSIEVGLLQLTPSKVISVAEVLDPLDERYLEKIFKQTIHQIYQATEGFIGYTCPMGILHLNEDLLIIEKEFIQGAANKFIPIITDLNRVTQPIIRYRLNDILTIKESPCECGSVLTALECIEGRCDDIFYFRPLHGDTLVTLYPDFLRRAVITASDAISEYKIIQQNLDLVDIAILFTSKTLDVGQEKFKIKHNLIKLWGQSSIVEPTIVFTDYQAPKALAKLKRVERLFVVEDREAM